MSADTTNNDVHIKKSKKAATAVLAELRGRRGFRQTLDECDDDIVQEIKDTLARIIAQEMAKS